jgi:GNAT superfamily N-acetyltransferase
VSVLWDMTDLNPDRSPVVDRDAFAAEFTSWMTGPGSTHLAWLAELDGAPVGILWLLPSPRVPRPHMPVRWTGDVQSFWIRPELRGGGLGRRMLDALLAEADSLGFERVTVHSSEGAVTLYERAGFAPGRTILNRPRR